MQGLVMAVQFQRARARKMGCLCLSVCPSISLSLSLAFVPDFGCRKSRYFVSLACRAQEQASRSV